MEGGGQSVRTNAAHEQNQKPCSSSSSGRRPLLVLQSRKCSRAGPQALLVLESRAGGPALEHEYEQKSSLWGPDLPGLELGPATCLRATTVLLGSNFAPSSTI